MKAFILLSLLMVVSCTLYTKNMLSPEASVTLNSANFKILGTVSLSNDVGYIFGISVGEQNVLSKLRSELSKKANIKDKSRALINVYTDCTVTGIPPIYYIKTIHMSADVIEFIEK